MTNKHVGTMKDEIPTKEELKAFIERLEFIYDHYDEMTNPKPVSEPKEDILHPKKYGPIGYVYIMENCGYYKIGKSKYPERRFGEYTKLPEEPKYHIVCKVKNYDAVEIALHAMFADKRNRGGECEWFCLTEEDLKTAKKFIYSYELKKKDTSKNKTGGNKN